MGDHMDQQQEAIRQAKSPGQTLLTPSQDYSARPDYISRSNLPAQHTPLIGREQAATAACTLLRRLPVRLVTFIGTGGIGKTSLALQVARDLDTDFAHGVCFVSLAPISDPDLVIPTIAQEFGLKEIGHQVLLDLLKASLTNKHLLLLLDNFEQILTAAPSLSLLLEACPHLKILVTSRASLHLHSEHEFPVPPLDLPDLTHLPTSEELSQIAAVALFLQRTQAVKPDMQLTTANVRAIAEICVRLDGLPLAIELAAARMKLFPPQALLARLGSRLQVLTSGTQDAPTRQQTLRNTIAWSYHLLNAQEQQLFRQLSVFVGGCSLQAVEAVCCLLGENHTETVLDGITSLIDKSLLHQTEQESEEPRFLMLETIREYGVECLGASGEEAVVQLAHARYYQMFSAQGGSQVWRGIWTQQVTWLKWFEREHDNIRAALRWLLEQAEKRSDQTSREIAMRMGVILQPFWRGHGHLSEGYYWLKRILENSEGVPAEVRAKILFAAGRQAFACGDLEWGLAWCEEALSLFRELDDSLGTALVLQTMGGGYLDRPDFARARPLLEEAMILLRAHEKIYLAWGLCNLGGLLTEQGQYAKAYHLFEESLALHREYEQTLEITSLLSQIARVLLLSGGDQARVHEMLKESLLRSRELGDTRGSAVACFFLGRLAFSQGDLATARAWAEEGLGLFQEIGVQECIARSLSFLGRIATALGDYTKARTFCLESLAILFKLSVKLYLPFLLEGLASVVGAQGEGTWAAQIWGTAEALRESFTTPLPPIERADYDRSVAVARTQVGEKAFAAAWAQGRLMTPEQVVAAQGKAALFTPIPPTSPLKTAVSSPIYPAGLTKREVEVLQLVAQGLTDARVAEQLVLTRRTVNWYLTSIYSKIQVSSRSAATRYAVDQHLV